MWFARVISRKIWSCLLFCVCVCADVLRPCAEDLSIRITEQKYTKFGNGTVLFEGALYPPDSYWIETDGTYRLCVCTKLTCWRKCCPQGEVFVLESVDWKCAPSNSSLVNPFIPPHTDAQEDKSHYVLTGKPRFPACHGTFPLTDQNDRYETLANGNLRVIHQEQSTEYNVSQYCWEVISGAGNADVIRPNLCWQSDSHLEMALEFENSHFEFPLLASIFFLVATIAVFVYTKPGWNYSCLLCYFISILVFFCSAALNHFQYFGHVPLIPCVLLALMQQFSFLAMFFWINVLCIKIWWMFSDQGLRNRFQDRFGKWKKDISFHYAWGCPFMITLFTVVVDLFPEFFSLFPAPGYGIEMCFIQNRNAMILFYFTPAGILVVMNLILFVTITVNLCIGNYTRKNVERFALFLKIFVLSGITWTIDFMSVFIDRSDTKVFWKVADIVNAFTGVFLFVIFVCNRNTLSKLVAKLCPQYKPFKDNNYTMTSDPTSAEEDQEMRLRRSNGEASDPEYIGTV